uniref:Maestro heat-like repeat-containing protein family member 1 n=1 Tax=Timema tahoe TaxID=61484 RepID=A0A7R9IA54_9NEOP|nr:unnamed protein product [Timema tahoe]
MVTSTRAGVLKVISGSTMEVRPKIKTEEPMRIVMSWSWFLDSPLHLISVHHQAALLHTMEHICLDHLSEVDGDVVLLLVQFSVEEMTRSPDYLPAVQMPASGILVALGKAHCNEERGKPLSLHSTRIQTFISLSLVDSCTALCYAPVSQVMEGLLKHLQPGVVPHYSILHTMGSLAAANVFGIVPFCPFLYLCVCVCVCVALGKFSEAVADYLVNIDHAPDPTVKLGAFSTEMGIAYDVLASSWLQSRDPKCLDISHCPQVCETVLGALGPMFALLPADKVAEQVPRLVPALLALYRRNMDPHPVTQCLAAVLLVVISSTKTSLEPHLDNLLNVMFDLVCTSPDYVQPLTVKNHYEVLRCFDRIALHFTDRLVELLVQQLKNNNDRERIKALFVITHLVNSSENRVNSRLTDLVFGLRGMLGEHNCRVKKVLLKTIVALAYRGYLSDTEGREFVEFIVRQCCPSTLPGKETDNSDLCHRVKRLTILTCLPQGKEINNSDLSATGVKSLTILTCLLQGKESDNAALSEELRSTCCNTLYLLATTVPQVEDLLWTLLLQLLPVAQYTPATGIITRCLTHLAAKKREEPSTNDNTVELPGPHVVFARCLALLGSPLESNRGVHVLGFLKNYANILNSHLKQVWNQRLSVLVARIEDTTDSWRDEVWEDLVLEFLSVTLTELADEKWSRQLGDSLTGQIPLYVDHPLEKAMLYKCLAVVIVHSTDKEFVNQQLEVLVGALKQASPQESKHSLLRTVLAPSPVLRSCNPLCPQSVARALGLCAREHLHPLLARLERLATEELARKSSRLLGFMKDSRHELELERLKTSLLLCYGEVALEAPGTQLLPRLEHGPAAWVLAQLRGAKGPRTKEAALETVGNIAESFHPNRNSLHIPLQGRSEILAMVLDQFQAQSADLHTTVLKVVTALVRLPPPLTPEERVVVLKACFTQVYQGIGGRGDVLSSLGSLVRQILLDSVSPATLDEMFTLLEPWLVSGDAHQREAAVTTLSMVLRCYLDNLQLGYESPSKFTQTGLLLGRLVPRCTDPCLPVRPLAVECVCLVLQLASRYEGHLADHDNDTTGALETIRQQIVTEDPSALFKVTGELARIICGKLPHFQLMHFSESLQEGLLDPETTSSSGASVVLNILLKAKGGELYHQVHDILAGLLQQLAHIHCPQTRTGTIRAVLALAGHHPKAVVSALLHRPLPFNLAVTECWEGLTHDPELCADIIDQFLRLVATTPPYEEEGKGNSETKIASLQPLAAISAMKEMFRVGGTMRELAIGRFADLFSCFLVSVGGYVGVSPPIYTPQQSSTGGSKFSFIPNRGAYKLNPARVAREAGCESIASALSRCDYTEAGDSLASFVDMVPGITRAVCTNIPHALPKLITALSQHATSTHESRRVAVAAFYSELVKLKLNGQVVLLESVINNLLNCPGDPSSEVRRLCLGGLAAVASLDPEQRARYSGPVVSALVQGLDDQGRIPLAAILGFSDMLPAMDQEHVRSVQTSVALRIKPYFQREDAMMRAAAIRMFGDLAKFGGVNSTSAFIEQVQGNFVSLLLHLSDCDDQVVKACKYSLRQTTPLLRAARVNAMVQDHLIDGAHLHYTHFMADLAKVVAEELVELVPGLVIGALAHIKSPWPALRGNAATFTGSLCGHLAPSDDINSSVQLDTVCARLVLLLRDEDASVRAKTARAMSSIFVT